MVTETRPATHVLVLVDNVLVLVDNVLVLVHNVSEVVLRLPHG